MDLKLALLAVDARQLVEERAGGCEARAGRHIRQCHRNTLFLGPIIYIYQLQGIRYVLIQIFGRGKETKEGGK